MKELIGYLIGFKNEKEDFYETPTILEIVEVDGDKVQIGFSLPATKNQRLYLTFPVSELVATAFNDAK